MENTPKNLKELEETLKKQLDLLSERSKDCSEEILADISNAMVQIYIALNTI